MKKFFAIVLCLIMTFSLACCSEPQNPEDSSSSQVQSSAPSTDGSSQTDSKTSNLPLPGTEDSSSSQVQSSAPSTDESSQVQSSAPSTDESAQTDSKTPILPLPGTEDSKPGGYDPEVEHKILVTDVRKGSVAILDLNLCQKEDFSDLKNRSCAIWEWTGGDAGLAGVKIRECEFYGGKVLAVASSYGWAAVIDYKTKQTLWYGRNMPNAHSIEVLPNGDILVAASGDSSKNYSTGGIYYYPAENPTLADFYSFPFAHAVVWDPQAEHVWIAGFPGVKGLTVKDGKLAEVEGVGVKRPTQFSAHDMAPIPDDPGKYWVSDNSKLYVFDSKKNTLEASSRYSNKEIKGIASFSDGTAVLSVAGQGNPSAGCFTTQLWVFYQNDSNGTMRTYRTQVAFSDREFYKIHALEPNYR